MQPIPCPVSSSELEALVHTEKLTDDAIAVRLGATKKRVQSWRKRFGVKALPRWARNEVTPIEGKLRSLLVGSMLGDGRLTQVGTSTRYVENHADDQKAYLEWKAALWGSWVKGPIKPVTWKTDGKEYPGWRFHTCAHGDLNPWWDLFYGAPGPKHLDPRVVDLVDGFALTIWYLDDGYAGWWPDIVFGMSHESRRVAEVAFEKFGLKPRWQVKRGNTGAFHMEREETAHRFLDLIRPHVPKCMAHKLGPFGFQGPHYEVREKVTEARLRDLAAQGVPIRRMARELGVGASTVSRWLTKLDISHSRTKGRPSRLVLGDYPSVEKSGLERGHFSECV